MTTKERSVEEMLREGMCDHYGDPSTRISEILERIEQTEHQKREEVVKNFAGMLRTLIERGNTETAMNIIREKSIQTNNSK